MGQVVEHQIKTGPQTVQNQIKTASLINNQLTRLPFRKIKLEPKNPTLESRPEVRPRKLPQLNDETFKASNLINTD
jgi:hypothetical protein